MQEKGYDSVFLGVGAGAPTFLGIPGEFAGQVYSANEFLTRVNLMGGDQFPYLDTPVNVGQSVVVIGAGNTAMDCLRVSKRIGAATVRCVYRRTEAEAPARIEEIRHAKEEGIEFFFLHAPVEIYVDADGNVTRHEGRGDGARRPRREGAPQARPHRPLQGPRRATRSSTRSAPRRTPSSRRPPRASASTSGATWWPTTRPRPRRSPASSPAVTSSPAAPRSSWPWAPGAAPPRASPPGSPAASRSGRSPRPTSTPSSP